MAKNPLQIVFRNLPHSDAVAFRVRQKAVWLEQFCDQVISMRVAIEAPHKHHRKGNLHRVRIDVRVPGEEIVVSREPSAHVKYRDLYLTIHDAFDQARRELEDYARRRRREEKERIEPPHGRITGLVRDNGGFGFIRSEDGRDIYFHGHSVLGLSFDDLELGMEVRFSEEMGEEGPQASTVEIVGKQGKHFRGDLKRAL